MATVQYGVTPQGFRRKTEAELIAGFEADQRAEIADNLDVSAESIIGQQNGIIGRHMGIAWEELEECYHAPDPDVAEGRSLENTSKLTGTTRQGNTPSEVLLVCNLDAGAVLVPFEAFAGNEDDPSIRWTPVAEFEAPSTGDHEVAFRSELTGPIEGFAGTINVIASPVIGWNSVVNPNDAELGLEVDTDEQLRDRREQEIATIGSATVRAIKANVAQAFAGKLQSLDVFENDGDVTNADGQPPHSVEVLIFDGDVPSVDDDELAQVIYESKAGGVRAYGTDTGNATAIVNGVETPTPQGFTRATQVPIYLVINLVKKAGYIGDAAVKEAVALEANEFFEPGEEIVEAHVMGFVTKLAGVKDVPSVQLGTSASPTSTANIPITLRQIGRFSTSRIVVNAT